MGKVIAVTGEGGKLPTVRNESGTSSPLPPDDIREWIDDNAQELRAGLASPTTRARLLELLLGERPQRGDDENGTSA